MRTEIQHFANVQWTLSLPEASQAIHLADGLYRVICRTARLQFKNGNTGLLVLISTL